MMTMPSKMLLTAAQKNVLQVFGFILFLSPLITLFLRLQKLIYFYKKTLQLICFMTNSMVLQKSLESFSIRHYYSVCQNG